MLPSVRGTAFAFGGAGADRVALDIGKPAQCGEGSAPIALRTLGYGTSTSCPENAATQLKEPLVPPVVLRLITDFGSA